MYSLERRGKLSGLSPPPVFLSTFEWFHCRKVMWMLQEIVKSLAYRWEEEAVVQLFSFITSPLTKVNDVS